MLAALGLDERDESAYRALVSAGAADVPGLARRLTLAEPDTERAELAGVSTRMQLGWHAYERGWVTRN